MKIFQHRSVIPFIWMKINKIRFGKKITFFGRPVLYRFRDSEITIGNGVTIRSSSFSNLIGLYQRTIIVARYGGKITIGDNVGMSGVTIYSWESIDIGEGTIIGANVKIMDTDFHNADPEMRQKGILPNAEPVKIGKNVFIGTGAIILKGTVIGDNCVVGAGAVVSGHYPNNSTIIGNPAKVMSYDQT